MGNIAISINNLHKTYRGASRPSVDGLSLQINQGAFFGLLGPNGAGKTTTISILCGLRSYDSGQVMINNMDVRSKMAQIKPLIGVVPQEIALYPELTVDENLRFFGGMYRLPSQEQTHSPGTTNSLSPQTRSFGATNQNLNERIDVYLKDFGLASHRKKKTRHLSGGMKRQVNLIAALLHRPMLLFLDEPTVGVDVHSRQVIIENLRVLHADGMTVVYTSHDMKEAEQLCTDVALVNHGRVVCEGVPHELIREASVSSLEDLFIKKTLQ